MTAPSVIPLWGAGHFQRLHLTVPPKAGIGIHKFFVVLSGFNIVKLFFLMFLLDGTEISTIWTFFLERGVVLPEAASPSEAPAGACALCPHPIHTTLRIFARARVRAPLHPSPSQTAEKCESENTLTGADLFPLHGPALINSSVR